MIRISTVLVSLSLVAIAASVAVAADSLLALDLAGAIAIGLATAIALLMIQSAIERARDRTQFERRVEELQHLEGTVTRTLHALATRVAMLEERLDAELDPSGRVDIDRALEPVLRESVVLGTLVKQLAETVAHLDQKIDEVAARPGPAEPPRPLAVVPPVVTTAPAEEIPPEPAMPAAPSAAAPEVDAEVEHLRALIESDAIDLFLQPIVVLPQRRPRYYEVLARLRDPSGIHLLPQDFLPYAERGGLMPKLDAIVVPRALQLLRRLTTGEREIGLFVNLSASSLAEGAPFEELVDLLKREVGLAGGLTLELSQATVDRMGPIELESLTVLSELGYRFSIDNVVDLNAPFRDLARHHGVRFVKVAANRLLEPDAGATRDIHIADFAPMLARFGIDLIVDRVESEPEVVDLLEYGVRYGQGRLFGPPRPVRNEILARETRPIPLRRDGRPPMAAGKN